MFHDGIKLSIRKFISLTSNIIGFELFFNLYRNKKYRHLNIDWSATFAVLHYGLPIHDTTFSASSSKAQRVKLMLNELPTIKQMKNSLYNIYKDWLCPVCDNYQETFAHIWECDAVHHSILQDIIRDSRSHLKELIDLHLLNDSFMPTRLKDLPF